MEYSFRKAVLISRVDHQLMWHSSRLVVSRNGVVEVCSVTYPLVSGFPKNGRVVPVLA